MRGMNHLPTAANPCKVILDTDIGDDIDDALALALILASPELKLLGVTTVFGNTPARTRQALTELVIAGRPDVPVATGCGLTMASRPHTSSYAAIDHVPNQDGTCLPADQLPKADPRHGVDFLIDTIMGGDGDIVPITIGGMTNLAMALVKEPRLRAKIPRIVSMVAEFRVNMAEWNVVCDPEAAHLVMASGIPVDVTTWHIGNTAKFQPADIERLGASEVPLAQYLHRAIAAWQLAHRWKDGTLPMPSLFDPLAVATMVVPDLCTWRRGAVNVELTGQNTYAYTRFKEQADGTHNVAWDVNRDRAITWYLDRILNYGRREAKIGG